MGKMLLDPPELIAADLGHEYSRVHGPNSKYGSVCLNESKERDLPFYGCI